MKFRALVFAVMVCCTLFAWTACGDDNDGNPAGVGNACETNDDCDTGECYQGPGGGYCTAACENEGEVDPCPRDTVCKPIQGGPARCLLICGSASACDGDGTCEDAECPTGSSCTDISNTDLRACEPNPN